MIKTAIFVEGQTELIFIREYLLKMFDYQNVSIACYTLFTDRSFNATEYAFLNDDAQYYFQIINVGNDNAVLSRLLRREQQLWNNGFHKIFGLRDMYSKDYREAVDNNMINDIINQKFIEGAANTIVSKAVNPDHIHFCFAIMETEAWILGLPDIFMRLYAQLTTVYIENQLGFNLDTIDPERQFFHPAKVLEDVYNLANETYNKSKGDISALMHYITKQDLDGLMQSNKCNSFRNFSEALLPDAL